MVTETVKNHDRRQEQNLQPVARGDTHLTLCPEASEIANNLTSPHCLGSFLPREPCWAFQKERPGAAQGAPDLLARKTWSLLEYRTRGVLLVSDRAYCLASLAFQPKWLWVIMMKTMCLSVLCL